MLMQAYAQVKILINDLELAAAARDDADEHAMMHEGGKDSPSSQPTSHRTNTMYFNLKTVFLSALAASALAAEEKRQASSVYDSLTSAAGSAFTGDAATYLSGATSAAGSALSGITSGAGSATSVAGSAISDATSGAASITSAAGSAASSATSAAGSAASSASSDNNGAASAFAVSNQLFVVAGSVLFGAFVVL